MKAMAHGDVGDITASNMVRARDRQLSQQVWVDPMRGVLLAGVEPFVDGLPPHQTHQSAHPVATGMEPISRQVGRNLAAAEEPVFGEHAVDLVHQLKGLCIHTNRRVLQRRPAGLQQLALTGPDLPPSAFATWQICRSRRLRRLTFKSALIFGNGSQTNATGPQPANYGIRSVYDAKVKVK